jgi:hypothetical protein
MKIGDRAMKMVIQDRRSDLRHNSFVKLRIDGQDFTFGADKPQKLIRSDKNTR